MQGDAREPVESAQESKSKTLDRLARMFADLSHPNSSENGDWPAVIFPFCPVQYDQYSHYVHIDRREAFLGNDNYDASARYDLGVRGDVTALHFWCEFRSHHWVLAFGAHKGELFVRVVRLADLTEADLTESEHDT
jgi:hypothetical protein